MEKPQRVIHERPLTPKEVAYYKNKLDELDKKAHEPGGNPAQCSETIWRIFDPKQKPGIQIYQNFTDEELLDIVIRTMNHQGHRPDFNAVYIIYRRYLQARFGGQNEIKARAKSRMKHLKNERDWPVDWQERVSIEPVLKRFERCKRSLSEADIALLEELCAKAKKHGIPIQISPADRQRLDRLGGSGNVLKAMGIPPLRGSELRHIRRYWNLERQKGTQNSASAEEGETI